MTESILFTITGVMLFITITTLLGTIYAIRRTKSDIMKTKHENATMRELVHYLSSNNHTKTIMLKEIAGMIKDIDSETDPGAMMVKLRSLRICMDLQSNMTTNDASYNINGMILDLTAPRIAPWLINVVDRYYAGREDHQKIVTTFATILEHGMRSDYLNLYDYKDGKASEHKSPEFHTDDYLTPFLELVEPYTDESRDEIQSVIDEIDQVDVKETSGE